AEKYFSPDRSQIRIGGVLASEGTRRWHSRQLCQEPEPHPTASLADCSSSRDRFWRKAPCYASFRDTASGEPQRIGDDDRALGAPIHVSERHVSSADRSADSRSDRDPGS